MCLYEYGLPSETTGTSIGSHLGWVGWSSSLSNVWAPDTAAEEESQPDWVLLTAAAEASRKSFLDRAAAVFCS